MKIFLCGGGDGKQAAAATRRFSEIISHDKPLLYVPLAMEAEQYPDCKKWITAELEDIHLSSIDMVQSFQELFERDLSNYCAIFIGGGNTYRLLSGLKSSGCFDKIADYIRRDGIIWGGSAGSIIFGTDIGSCQCDDRNDVGLADTSGFDVLNGISLLCHYTNHEPEKERINTEFLLHWSNGNKIIALPEEDTIFINGDKIEFYGTRPYYEFENGVRIQRENSDFGFLSNK